MEAEHNPLQQYYYKADVKTYHEKAGIFFFCYEKV